MPATHVVLRSFPGPGGRMVAGTEVDASGWRNAEALVRRRYLRIIPRVTAQPEAETAAKPDAAQSRNKR